MKKRILLGLTLVPVIVGFLINQILLVPSLTLIAVFVIPLFVLVFWFILGRQYAKTEWNYPVSVLIAHGTGLVSFGLYLWQFCLLGEGSRNLVLALISQYYSAAVPTWLLSGIAGLLAMGSSDTRVLMTILQILALVLMVIAFSLGFSWEKKHPVQAG